MEEINCYGWTKSETKTVLKKSKEINNEGSSQSPTQFEQIVMCQKEPNAHLGRLVVLTRYLELSNQTIHNYTSKFSNESAIFIGDILNQFGHTCERLNKSDPNKYELFKKGHRVLFTTDATTWYLGKIESETLGENKRYTVIVNGGVAHTTTYMPILIDNAIDEHMENMQVAFGKSFDDALDADGGRKRAQTRSRRRTKKYAKNPGKCVVEQRNNPILFCIK